MRLAEPWALLVWILIPVYLGLRWYGRRAPQGAMISTGMVMARVKQRRWWWVESGYIVLLVMVMGLFGILLARPQRSQVQEDVRVEGIDIVLALDVSGSMLAEDIQPNRLQAAKKTIGDFVATRSTDRIGLVVFAGKAFTQSPLTVDYDLVGEYLDQITTEMIDQRISGLSGTAIGDAILAGVQRLSADTERSKVLVLVTDGDANVGVEPLLAAQKAAAEGVRVYTIGVGSEDGAYIPTVDSLGQKTYLRDETGALMVATFDEEQLRRLATETGGMYFRATDAEGFTAALAEIDALERDEVRVNQQMLWQDAYEPLLVGLIGVMLLTLGLGWYRGGVE